ncbi:MAG: class I SAM-dependent methyltransferase [Paracoccaceae bacterium]
MHLDVVDLRNFYYRTGLGRAAQRAIREQVLQLWPEAKGRTVVGFGFAVPLLRPYLADARRVVALMPGPQGVMPWPAGPANVSVLCEETSWPLETGHADRLLVMHGLEASENQGALLDECWRVLGPGGKAIVVVPNRAGLWSRRDVTPFGYGRPYSLGQLETQIKDHQFVPERHRAALFQPPSHKRFWLKTGPIWEKAGRRISAHYAGGVLLLEVSKRSSAPTPAGLSEAVKRPLMVLDGIAKPGAEPV